MAHSKESIKISFNVIKSKTDALREALTNTIYEKLELEEQIESLESEMQTLKDTIEELRGEIQDLVNR